MINGKVYIGKTSRSISQRFKEHIELAKLGYDNMLICRAIRKYGEDNFSIELIEGQINNQEVDSREKYWIDFDQFMETYADSIKYIKSCDIGVASQHITYVELDT